MRVTGVHKGGQAQAPAARSSSIGCFLFVEVRGGGQGGIHGGWGACWEERVAGEMVGNVQEPLLASLDAPLPAPTEAPAEIRHRTLRAGHPVSLSATCSLAFLKPSSNRARIHTGWLRSRDASPTPSRSRILCTRGSANQSPTLGWEAQTTSYSREEGFRLCA